MVGARSLKLCTLVGLMIMFALAPLTSKAQDAPTATKPADQESVFGLTKLHKLHLQISAQDYAAMDPKGGGPPGFGGGPGRPGPGGPGAQGGLPAASGFGYGFESVHASLQANDENFKDVGVRYKGNATYMMSARLAKRPFKIDFDEYEKGVNFHGVKKLNLHCSVFDTTKAKESLAYAVFRAAGIPAPQTSLAEVSLTVPGKYEAEYLGLYTVVEQVDKPFLKTHFKSAKGLLLKPEGMRGIQYLGDAPAAYQRAYDGKTDADEKQWRRLVDFAKLINQASDERFEKEIGEYLDIEMFLRYLAVNSLLVNFDSFIGLGHNYYLYLVPESNKFVFFPWDLDLAFGSHPMFGPMDRQIDISIDHPHVGEINLIDRLLSMTNVKKAYRAEVRRLNETVFSSAALAKQIEEIELLTKGPLAREKKAAEARKEGGGFGFGGPGFGNPFGGEPMELRKFVEKRAAAVAAQLAGKSQGVVPRPGMGPGGPGPGGPGGPGNPFGPGGNLGGMLARPVLNATDANKDGKLSKEEIESAAQLLLRNWDKDKNGVLDEREVAEAINSLVQPPRFGPAGAPNRGPTPPSRP